MIKIPLTIDKHLIWTNPNPLETGLPPIQNQINSISTVTQPSIKRDSHPTEQ